MMLTWEIATYKIMKKNFIIKNKNLLITLT